MKTSITKQEGKITATLAGSLDTAAAEQTARELAPLNDCEGRDIEIDCHELTYISSSGLRILLSIRKRAAAFGSQVTLKDVSDDIRDVLLTTGFTKLFNIV